VALLQVAGIAANRVTLSGATVGRYSGDISIPPLGIDRTVEVKVRENGFPRLYDWLDGRDILIIRKDRSAPLVVVPWRLAVEIAIRAETAPRDLPGNGASLRHLAGQSVATKATPGPDPIPKIDQAARFLPRMRAPPRRSSALPNKQQSKHGDRL
jgi:hypothetical protein